jgi:UDP-N-acetylglucosamine--N-acetylmuramyl-(pentapeptide) pyrophosphoryl-undecaprenol N-acetylglucosamine transferase
MTDGRPRGGSEIRRALLAGGGSGGHIFPALAVGEELARRGWSVSLAGSPAGMEARIAAERNLPFVALAARPLLGKRIWEKLAALLPLAFSALAARRQIRAGAFDVVIGTGGYASARRCSAAAPRRPTVLIEPNAEARPRQSLVLALPPRPARL